MRINIPKNVKSLLDTLTFSGFKAYIVGGCVRDSLLGINPLDFDVCTNALPDDVIRLFNKTVNTGIKHGTVTVIADKTPVEVTTFRIDGGYKDYRRPESVQFVSDLKGDLSRRDFTINAMCYNENEGLIDYFGGAEDLEKKTVKAVGDPDLRFNEDALRILRLFRFCAVLDFTADKKTLDAAIKNAPLLKNISTERIEKELRKTASGKNPAAILPLMSTGVIPTLKANENILKIKDLPPNEKLKFFAFLSLLSTDLTKTLDFLKCSNAFKDYSKRMSAALKVSIKTRADIKRLLCLFENDIFDLLSYKSRILGEDTAECEKTVKEILKKGEPYKISHLAISGEEIIKKGYRGEEVGNILSRLLSAVIETPELNTKGQLNKLF